MTSPDHHFPRYWPFVWGIHRSLLNSPHKGQWRGALMVSLICAAWTDGCVNTRDAGDLWRYRVHYVIVMFSKMPPTDTTWLAHKGEISGGCYLWIQISLYSTIASCSVVLWWTVLLRAPIASWEMLAATIKWRVIMAHYLRLCLFILSFQGRVLFA